MYGQDRVATREVFFRAWGKYRQQQDLEGVETVIVSVALQHPEYHSLLEHPETSQGQDFLAPGGKENPFLHMGMHIALEEQLSLNQPVGIQTIYQDLLGIIDDAHTAQHRMLACLGEALWQAQQDRCPPDEAAYLECLRRLR